MQEREIQGENMYQYSKTSLVVFFHLLLFHLAATIQLKKETEMVEEMGETSLVLPAVIQVMEGISEQVEDEKPAKGSTQDPPSGHRMPPGLLRLVALRNALVTVARQRKLHGYSGFSDETYALLKESSRGTAAQQLKTLLEAMLSRKELKEEGDEVSVSELASDVVKDLGEEKSDLSTILSKVKAIKYT